MLKQISFPSPAAKIRIISLCVLIGFIFAVYYHGFMIARKMPYPYTTFLFYPIDRFGDFFKSYDAARLLNPYFDSPASNYFPVAYILFYPFTWLSPVIAFLVFTAMFISCLIWMAYYFLRQNFSSEQSIEYWQTTITLIFLSYPVLFCLDRSNIENMLFILVALFVIAFINKKYNLAAVLLALAAGMKLYPFALIVLFIKRKQYKAAMSVIIYFLLLTLASYSCLKGGLIANFNQSLVGFHQYASSYYILDNGFNFYTTMFSFVKINIYHTMSQAGVVTQAMLNEAINHVLPYYTLATLIIYGLLSLHILCKETLIWKQLLLLIGAIILFPPASADYKLIYLFIPLFLYMSSNSVGPYNKLYITLFALLLIPKNYIVFANGLSLMSIMNTIILSSLMIVIIYEAYRYPVQAEI